MQELIDRITSKVGISAAQAAQTLGVVKEFVKEKFPMVGGAVDNILGGDNGEPQPAAAPAPAPAAAVAAQAPAAEPKKEEGGSFLDKISDVIPGAIGEKIEEVAKSIGGKLGM
jgi:hypothetical protein